MPSILEAGQAEVAKVVAETPSQFTVGGSFDGKTLSGGLTYDRHWSNGWGATAYLRAWWDDLPISTIAAPKVAAGVQVTKRFP